MKRSVLVFVAMASVFALGIAGRQPVRGELVPDGVAATIKGGCNGSTSATYICGNTCIGTGITVNTGTGYSASGSASVCASGGACSSMYTSNPSGCGG